MKRIGIRQHGESKDYYLRDIVLVLPDDAQNTCIDDPGVIKLIEEMADQAGIEWEFQESDGIDATECNELHPDAPARRALELEITTDMLAEVMSDADSGE